MREIVIQIAVRQWFDETYPEFSPLFFHFANERKCSPQTGMLLKRCGVKRGVSDVFITCPRGGFSGLWLELKTGRGKLSTYQRNFSDMMIKQGFAASCAHSLDAAKLIINDYLKSGGILNFNDLVVLR